MEISSDSSDDEPEPKRSKEVERVGRSARLSSKPKKRYSDWDSDFSESIYYLDATPEHWTGKVYSDDEEEEPIENSVEENDE